MAEYHQATSHRDMERKTSGLAPVVIRRALKDVGDRARRISSVAGAFPFTPSDQVEIMESWSSPTRRRKFCCALSYLFARPDLHCSENETDPCDRVTLVIVNS